MSDKCSIMISRMTTDEADAMTPEQHYEYKMSVWQMVDNLNHISSRFAYKRINQENPTQKIKQMLMNFYH